MGCGKLKAAARATRKRPAFRSSRSQRNRSVTPYPRLTGPWMSVHPTRPKASSVEPPRMLVMKSIGSETAAFPPINGVRHPQSKVSLTPHYRSCNNK